MCVCMWITHSLSLSVGGAHVSAGCFVCDIAWMRGLSCLARTMPTCVCGRPMPLRSSARYAALCIHTQARTPMLMRAWACVWLCTAGAPRAGGARVQRSTEGAIQARAGSETHRTVRPGRDRSTLPRRPDQRPVCMCACACLYRHRHVPKVIYSASKTKRTMLGALARREANERAHSAPGAVPFRAARTRQIVTTEE
jgi:hypothetical protein